MESKPAQSPLVAGIDQPPHDLPMDHKGSSRLEVSFIAVSGALVGNAGKEGSVTEPAGPAFLRELTSATVLKKWIAVLVTGKGDTVKERSICFVTLTDRFSRLFLCTRIERKTAAPVRAAMVEMLRKVKGKLHTLTLDNGGKFAEHRKRTEATGVPVSCAGPCASRQRKTSENSNGRLQKMWLKKFDIATCTVKESEDGLYNSREGS